ncbi:N-acetylglucosamine kinase [Rhodanobacter glycinis]|jgi:N-acetylglucosamine kinase-like BadF-type ATPase|uniref:N-acetylglucosamine kinase n=1 Tax=Rhodanobacter glycinis TaxID=582702 RepID=A0A5B9DVS0_9GAMM|nr:BadF/BadG/BcrA/BcrD ATPase family protein [Rhodanobacter glycinis]QEE23329.1 N-acetylglucosamine kinase [Rhodanobacter glycinis]
MFLGVDGGGTKTGFCLMNQQGRIVSMVTTGSCSYFAAGFDGMERALRQGVEETCREAEITSGAIEYAFFGLPTYGESSNDLPLLDQIPARILGHDRFRCDNDMVCGWAGSLGAADGINVIAGTGSMAYGEHGDRKARCGGWSELFGDEGSAYWIAVQGLSCFTRMSDGRMPKSALHDSFKSHLALTNELDLIDVVVNQWQGDRVKIASLSKLVVAAAEEGDREALKIIERGAVELAEQVDVTRQRLQFSAEDEVVVSYSGGVFSAGDIIVNAFKTKLSCLSDRYALHSPLYSPAVGAAMYAARLNRTPIVARVASNG